MLKDVYAAKYKCYYTQDRGITYNKYSLFTTEKHKKEITTYQ